MFIRATGGHSSLMKCPVDLSLRIAEMGGETRRRNASTQFLMLICFPFVFSPFPPALPSPSLSLVRTMHYCFAGAADVLVHGTYFRCWNAIRNDGLVPPASILSFATHTPRKGEILKGMTKTPEVLVFVDMALAMQEGGVRFYRDEGGNIVSAGQHWSHCIPPIYFSKVICARDGSSLLSVEEVATMRVRERERAEAETKRLQIAADRALKAKEAADARAAANAKKVEKATKVNPYLAHLQAEEEEEEEENEGEWEDSRKKKKIRLGDE